MSNEEPVIEWKTIRISATSYYKLAELSGLFQAVSGTKVPLSLIVEWAIVAYHDKHYPDLKKMLMDPNAIKRVRKKLKEFAGEMSELFGVSTKPEYDV